MASLHHHQQSSETTEGTGLKKEAPSTVWTRAGDTVSEVVLPTTQKSSWPGGGRAFNDQTQGLASLF